MPNVTPNYGLFKPTGNENVDISILNDNMDILDEELSKKPDAEDIPTKLSELTEDENHRLSTDTEKEKWNGKANKPTTATITMSASGWSNGEYSFESTYPVATYDISIELNGDSATDEQVEAWSSAKIIGSATANKAIAKGDIPTVDIPIIVRSVVK